MLQQQQEAHQTQTAIERAKGLDVAKAEVEAGQPKRYKQGLVDAGFSEEQATQMTRAKFMGVAARPKFSKVSYSDPQDPSRTLFGLQDENPYSPSFGQVMDSEGQPVENPGKVVTAMLPTQSSTVYDPNTGRTSHEAHKVAPGATGGAGRGSKAPVPSTKSSVPTATPGGGSPAATAPAPAKGRVASMAQQWQDNGIEPGVKDKPAVQQYMQANGMAPGVKPTVKEIGLRDDIKKVEPMVARLQSFIEDNGLQKAGEGGMFSPSAWWERSKTEKAWQEYSKGIAPKDKKLGELIKLAASIKIMGAAPWMSLGRGKYLYSEIVQHLPEPTDTPAQLYEKGQFYRHVLEDAKASLPPALQGKMAPPPPAPAGPAAPTFGVGTPNKTYLFADQAAADAFKREAGIL